MQHYLLSAFIGLASLSAVPAWAPAPTTNSGALCACGEKCDGDCKCGKDCKCGEDCKCGKKHPKH